MSASIHNAGTPVPGELTITPQASPDCRELWDQLEQPPPPPAEAAFHGIAGQLTHVIAEHSEAAPVALLVQTLVAVGNMIGRTAHFEVEGDSHYLNAFVCLVGTSSKGRKGTSWGRINKFLGGVDPDWANGSITGGLSSGEGLIAAVRDPITKMEPVKDENGTIRPFEFKEVTIDAGVTDKRVLCYEPEFASVLKVLERQGNTLSTLIRQAWDDGKLRTLVKNSPAKATGAHVSIIAHVTREDLHRYLSETDQANGFGNRFLWIAVSRAKVLPLGGSPSIEALQQLHGAFASAINWAKGQTHPIGFDDIALEKWEEVYPVLSAGRPGLSACMLARAEAQVRRLACLFAVLDRSPEVRLVHLSAALALWKYCESSVYYVFGSSLGNDVADKIQGALQETPAGLTREEIRSQVLKGHRGSKDIGRALSLLFHSGLAHRIVEMTGGRPAERWFAGPAPAAVAAAA
jgi:hypothetical protein